MIFSVRPIYVFRKPCFIALLKLAVVGLKIDACRYWDSYGLDVCTRIVFVTASGFCVSRGTSHILVFLFLVPLIISWPLFCTDIYCLSSVMVHPSSHNIPNDISGAVFIFWKYGSASLYWLDLLDGVFLCMRTPSFSHLVVFLSVHFTLLLGPL